VIESDVRDGGDPAVPGVRRVKAPAQPYLDQRDVDARLSEMAKDDRGQQFELGRLAVPIRYVIGDGEDGSDVSGEVRHGDGMTVDLDTLAVADKVRFRGLADAQPGRAKCRPRKCEDAALPVRPADQRPAHRSLWIAEGREKSPGPSKTEPDTEPASGRKRCQRVVILGRQRCAAHSRVSSSS
jgi:hypothetical protein